MARMGDAKPRTSRLEDDLDIVLRKQGVRLTGAEVAAAVRVEERRRAAEGVGAAATTSSQPTQDSFLRDSSGLTLTPDPGAAMFRFAFHTASEDMLTASQAADLTGKAKSTITRRVASRDLYSVKSDGTLRLPTWQFVDGKWVPGLRQALTFVPETWGPRRLRVFMTTPEESFNDRSPVQWLLDGEDPKSVSQLMDAETRE